MDHMFHVEQDVELIIGGLERAMKHFNVQETSCSAPNRWRLYWNSNVMFRTPDTVIYTELDSRAGKLNFTLSLAWREPLVVSQSSRKVILKPFEVIF